VSDEDQNELLMAIGALEQALTKLQERLGRLEKIADRIAMSLGIMPKPQQ